MTIKNKRGWIWAGVITASILLDQITKQLAVTYLKPIATFPIVNDVLHLTYVTNYGAAFGILSEHRWVYILISTVAIVLLGCYLFEKRGAHPLLCTALSCIVGGGIGNMIDRIFVGYVVDFVDFRLIHFAVFNVADIFVCVGCAMMFLWLFRYAEQDELAVIGKTKRDDPAAKADIPNEQDGNNAVNNDASDR